MTPIHDHLYGRPSSAYGEPGSEPCPEQPPAPCVEVMEQTAHASVRTLLQALFAVDIDDPASVEAFQNRRRREAELHQLIEKAMTGTLWGVAKITAAILLAIAPLHVKEIAAWFGKP